MTPENIIRHAWSRRPAGKFFNPLGVWHCNVPISQTGFVGSAKVTFTLVREVSTDGKRQRFTVTGKYDGTSLVVDRQESEP